MLVEEEIIKSIKRLFGNTAVSPETTAARLLLIREEIDSCLECLREGGTDC